MDYLGGWSSGRVIPAPGSNLIEWVVEVFCQNKEKCEIFLDLWRFIRANKIKWEKRLFLCVSETNRSGVWCTGFIQMLARAFKIIIGLEPAHSIVANNSSRSTPPPPFHLLPPQYFLDIFNRYSTPSSPHTLI